MLVNKAALCSILLSAASTILPGVQVQAQEYEISSDGTIIEPPELNSDVNVGPIEHNSDPSRIIAAFASEEGLAELEAHVAEEKKNGRSISMGKARTFSKLRKAGGRGAGGGGGRGGGLGAGAAGGGGGGKNGRGGSSASGGSKGKGKGRYLQETDDIPPALGFAVIETTSDFTEEEYVKLEMMPGIAFVESDVEVYIDDHESLGLRGGPREHVRSIMESMAMEMVRRVCYIDVHLCMMCMYFVLCIYV